MLLLILAGERYRKFPPFGASLFANIRARSELHILELHNNVAGSGAKQTVPENAIADPDADHVKERNEWFYRGRIVRGLPSAELRRRAYETKLRLRAQRMAAAVQGQVSLSTGS